MRRRTVCQVAGSGRVHSPRMLPARMRGLHGSMRPSFATALLTFFIVLRTYSSSSGTPPHSFGYAEFSDADSAETALHEMNDSELDGFRLRLDFATARPGVSSRGGREPNAPTETVFIGNLPYTYDSTDLRQVLTEAMGGSIEGLQDVRLPPVPVMNDPINPFPEESVNKGFGFISFNSQEAAVAFKEALEAKIEQDGFTLHGEKVPRLDFAQAAAPRERSSYNNDRRSGGGFDDRRQSRGGYGGDRQSRGGYGGDRQSRGGYGGDRQSRGYGGDRQSRGYGGDRQSGGGFRRAREDYNDY